MLEDCDGSDMVCGVGSFGENDGFVFDRRCLNRNEFNQYKALCDANEGSCVVAMCDTPNCRPELPIS